MEMKSLFDCSIESIDATRTIVVESMSEERRTSMMCPSTMIDPHSNELEQEDHSTFSTLHSFLSQSSPNILLDNEDCVVGRSLSKRNHRDQQTNLKVIHRKRSMKREEMSSNLDSTRSTRDQFHNREEVHLHDQSQDPEHSIVLATENEHPST